jgi:hypothetical protein
MATNTKNVIVGAASLFTSVGNSSNNNGRPTTTQSDLSALLPTDTSARTGLLNSSLYREVGYTSTGLEVSYEPTYGEVMVDQLLDAARIFKQTLKIMLKTELTEATLENLQFSWGQMDNVYVANSTNSVVNVPTLLNNDSAVNSTPDTPAATLNMAAGALGDAPVERVLIAVGQAPAQIGTSAAFNDPATTGLTPVVSVGTGTTTAVNRNKERVYVARRVVSIDTTMHALKRDAATVFPVNFRCLPDSNASYAGAEYGVVIDRVYGSF